jgi:hypothetical protein
MSWRTERHKLCTSAFVEWLVQRQEGFHHWLLEGDLAAHGSGVADTSRDRVRGGARLRAEEGKWPWLLTPPLRTRHILKILDGF